MDVFNRDELARLQARVDARIATGIAAARYDGDGSAPASSGSHPERIVVGSHRETCPANTDDEAECGCGPMSPDPISEQANDDLAALQAAVNTVDKVCAAYPSITAGQRTIPGLTPCPPHRCVDCWAAGIERRTSQRRYELYCRRCGDHRKRNGYPIPPAAIQALARCDGDWSHWSVRRALRAS